MSTVIVFVLGLYCNAESATNPFVPDVASANSIKLSVLESSSAAITIWLAEGTFPVTLLSKAPKNVPANSPLKVPAKSPSKFDAVILSKEGKKVNPAEV